ncbi:hypothetical protein RIF29_12763 [Crotalaria pallida]|uniref:Uncharacterized protein n=1 Tax=Crotalaria pallida TaxID=3830 RepID=A0AAN9P1A4_CROPI
MKERRKEEWQINRRRRLGSCDPTGPPGLWIWSLDLFPSLFTAGAASSGHIVDTASSGLTAPLQLLTITDASWCCLTRTLPNHHHHHCFTLLLNSVSLSPSPMVSFTRSLSLSVALSLFLSPWSRRTTITANVSELEALQSSRESRLPPCSDRLSLFLSVRALVRVLLSAPLFLLKLWMLAPPLPVTPHRHPLATEKPTDPSSIGRCSLITEQLKETTATLKRTFWKAETRKSTRVVESVFFSSPLTVTSFVDEARRSHGGFHCRTWWHVEFTPCGGFPGGSRGGRDGSLGGARINCGIWRQRVVDDSMIEGDLVVVGCSAVVAGGGIVGTGETREGDGGGSVFLDGGAALDEGEREDDNVSMVVGGVVLFAGDDASGGIDFVCGFMVEAKDRYMRVVHGGYKIVIVVIKVVGKGKGSMMDSRSHCVGKGGFGVGNAQDEFVVEKKYGDLLFPDVSLPL